MDYYAIGQDKTLEQTYTQKQVDEIVNQAIAAVLPLAGGSMTGNIGYNGGARNGEIIRFFSGDKNGNAIVIGDGGLTIVAGGEAANAVFGTATPASEELILANDGVITFYTNVQNGVAGASKVTLSKEGLLSGHQKAITYGTAAPSGGSSGDIYIQY